MTARGNEQAMRKAIDDLNRRDLDSYLDFYDDRADALHYLGPQLPHTKQGARLFYAAFLTGFSDLHVALQHIVADEDSIAALFRLSGTQDGEFMGAPPSGRKVDVEGITMFRMKDGRCVERWNQLDQVAFMQQLGLMPAP